MSVPATPAVRRLAEAMGRMANFLAHYAKEEERPARIALLRATAACVKGLSVFDILHAIPFKTPEVETILSDPWFLKSLTEQASQIAEAIDAAELPPSYAIGILAENARNRGERRAAGEFYTDYRLAELLIQEAFNTADQNAGTLFDPAAGAGAFLVAGARHAHALGYSTREFVESSLYGMDLSSEALDACVSALLIEAPQIDTIRRAFENLYVADSLLLGSPRRSLEWRLLSPIALDQGFSFVVGNPPWEKLKLHAHEYSVLTAGGKDAYGTPLALTAREAEGLADQRSRLKSYVRAVQGRGLGNGGAGDADLYKFFVELAAQLVKPDGTLAMLLPGGLLRSQGAQYLREQLQEAFQCLDFIVFDNRARFFPIDTRFKFVGCVGRRELNGESTVLMSRGGISRGRAAKLSSTRLDTALLAGRISQAGLPEVFDDADRDIFRHLVSAGSSSTRVWGGAITREVDMTFDKASFQSQPDRESIPVIEGRMVHQFTHAAKSYVSGQGRSANWLPIRECIIAPQFYIVRGALKREVRERAKTARVGFCDVTGQTNERTLLAAAIPTGVVCGNKVPTISFPDRESMFAWIGLANSFVVDWLVRKLTTTSINFFIVEAIPLPARDNAHVGRIAELASRLSTCTHSDEDVGDLSATERRRLRAELDIEVANAYSLDRGQLVQILSDFKLLDRAMPALPRESRSTVTRDYLLATWESLDGVLNSQFIERWQAEARIGAMPYVSTDLARAADMSPLPSVHGDDAGDASLEQPRLPLMV